MSTKDLQSALKIIEAYGLTVTKKRQTRKGVMEDKVDAAMNGKDENDRRKIDPHRIEKIRRLWDEDMAVPAIAKATGVSKSAVYRYCVKY